MAEIKFRALKTFESADLRSTYVEGMFYTIREGNELNKILQDRRIRVRLKTRKLGDNKRHGSNGNPAIPHHFVLHEKA